MDKSGIYARDSLSSISLILSYIPKIPDFREYVTIDLIGGKNKSVMTLNEVHQTGKGESA